MSGLSLHRAAWLLVLALSAAACSEDNEDPQVLPEDGGSVPDAQVTPDAGDGAVDIDAGTDAAVAARLSACLDRPGAPPSAPTGALPCELLPPGFVR